MNPEVKESEYVDTTTPTYTVESDASLATVSADEQPLLPPATSTTNEQWRQAGERVYTFLASLPEYLSDFFGEYKRPLITLGLIFGSIVSVKLTLALLDAVNDIPLLAPTFELIGFGYTAWFIYRYLGTASSRQELTTKFNSFKDDIVGKS
ncbi:CAAD domain-containing protein [Leptolyngbya sp. FACHB-36]|uniref:CAAD domain-containing protein n=1 Tax=Leptolyngbya sp. FACHB-36 TaxID=2692808 RepID=UPI0016819E9D|nr:CAAD domain-containing protein [Leptolyngbya sp. FACHB-36]MBD2021312.1 CAAD domain-containing protein [Leptolyngbya sp. FACHB-36]